VIKPLHGNHYRVARRWVPPASTTAGIIWVIRNPAASGFLFVVKRLLVRAVQIAAPTAAIEDIFNVKVARAYTVADTTGSISIAPAANMQEMRSSMATASAQVRESNVAAGASGGTKTLDTDGIATGSVWVAAALPAATGDPKLILDYYPNVADGEHPLTLAENEGVAVSNTNSFGATSGIILHAEMYWAEVTAY
jgi:hypothetical protein